MFGVVAEIVIQQDPTLLLPLSHVSRHTITGWEFQNFF